MHEALHTKHVDLDFLRAMQLSPKVDTERSSSSMEERCPLGVKAQARVWQGTELVLGGPTCNAAALADLPAVVR